MKAYRLAYKFTETNICNELYNKVIGLEPESTLIIDSHYIIERHIIGSCLFYVHLKDVTYDKADFRASSRIEKICWYISDEEESY